MAQYLHACAFLPAISTFQECVNKGNFLSWSGIDTLNFEKLLGKQEATLAIIEGGTARLRPVILTAITTVLGLIPLAIGLNIDFFSLFSEWDPRIYIGGDNVIFWGPLAWTVIFGLTFATFLTLVIVPATFSIIYSIKLWIKKIF